MYSSDLQKWIDEAVKYLKSSWGLDASFAGQVALLFLYFHHYGLSPVITSGWRSPEKQAELLSRYNAGDRSVVAKPAINSKHLDTNWLGQPAAHAVDISTNNPQMAANIAQALGIGAGYFFSSPDPVHYQT